MAFYDNFLDGTMQRLGYTKAVQQPISAVFAGEGGDSGIITAWGEWTEEQIQKLATTSSWVYSDINAIAQALITAQFGVHRKSGEGLEAIEAHDFETLLEWPNPFMDQTWLLEYSAWWYLLRGEAYWWLVQDRAGNLSEIWPIPAPRMQPISDATKYISGYAYTSKKDGRAVRIPSEQVMFVRRPNPFDFHRGMSPISAYRLTLEGDASAAQWNRDTFTNELTLRTLISLPETISAPVFNVLRQEIVDELEGKRRRWIIARAGDVTVESLGLSHKDAEFLALRDLARREIDRVYGIPEGYWSEKANRANAEAAKASMIENAVWPIAIRFAQAITGQILRPYYGDDLRGEFEDIRPRDRAMLIEERRQYWQVKTVNEARSELGMTELDDPELGEKLVPLAVRSGNPPFGGGFGVGESVEGNKAIRDDLRRWQSVAFRQLKAGGNPADYDFESEYIPADMVADIKASLVGAATGEEVKAAFAAGFRRSSIQGFRAESGWAAAYP